MDKYLFTSQRLGFRNWLDQDLIPMAALNSDKEVMRFFPATQDLDKTRNFIEKQKADYKASGHCFFAVDLLQNSKFIGFIGFKAIPFTASFTPGTEIGWRLAKTHWNQGLATEGAKANLEYAFKVIHLKEIYSFTITENVPSQKVMEKIGMVRKDVFEHPNLPQGHSMRKHVLYHLLKE